MWTASKIDKGFSNGQVFVRVLLTDGKDVLDEMFYSRTTPADWPDSAIRSRIEELNSIDVAVIQLGALGSKPDDRPTPPTQDELDLQVFAALCGDYRQKSAAVKAGVGKTTQADVDAIVGQIKAAYKDEYAAILVDVF